MYYENEDELRIENHELKSEILTLKEERVDIKNFIKWLQLEDLYTPQLEDFIKYYLRNHNE